MKWIKTKIILTSLFFIMILGFTGMALAADTVMTEASILPDSSAVLDAGAALQDGIPDINYAAWPQYGNIYLMVNITDAGDVLNDTPNFTIVKGDNPPSFRSGLGDLNISITGNGVYVVGPLESARFLNQTGYLRAYGTNITAGTITLIETVGR
jgi:hypothetical protein